MPDETLRPTDSNDEAPRPGVDLVDTVLRLAVWWWGAQALLVFSLGLTLQQCAGATGESAAPTSTSVPPRPLPSL